MSLLLLLLLAHRAPAADIVPDSDSTMNMFVGKEMTWYPTDTGPDACTGMNHLDSDFYVAMGTDQFKEGCCGRQLNISYNGRSAVATCVDECATCPQWGQLDLTKGLFEFFVGDPGIGIFYGSWSYIDGDPKTSTQLSKVATTTVPAGPESTTGCMISWRSRANC
ncbi:hypothetical protein B0H14DRAFT_2727358, partial [Mycena olivaceomarginata]